jgi:MFS family permease
VRDVLGAVLTDPPLRRVGLAYAGFNAAEWAVWIALLVYAYGHGGAPAASAAVVVQLIPAAIFAPFAARLADHHAPARVLAGGYLAQSATMAATAAALAAGAPPAVVLALAGAVSSAMTITRPAQAAMVPALVRTPDALTATNVVLSWIESISVCVAPAVTGVLLAISVPATVFAVMSALALASWTLVAGTGAAPAPSAEHRAGAVAEVLAGLAVVARDSQARLLSGVLGMQFVLIGALDVLFVVLAIDVLDLGGSGAGYLNAAFGAGGVIALAVTIRLVGRRRLAPALVAAALAWSLAMLVLGLWPTVVGAFTLLAAAGAARALLDVAARTLLQRSAPAGVLARVFGVLETLDAIGLALGGVLAALLVAVLGPEAAVAGLAALMPLLLALTWRGLRTADARASVPIVEIALLRSHALFSSLRAPVLERLARELTAIAVPAGYCVIREGEPGRRYYVIADGQLEVTRSGLAVARVGRGDGVGEVSLLAGVPCTATVTALTAARLYAIEPQTFFDVVGGHPTSAAAGRRLVGERRQSPAST